MKAYILNVSHEMVNGRSLQLVEMGVKGGVKQVATDPCQLLQNIATGGSLLSRG